MPPGQKMNIFWQLRFVVYTCIFCIVFLKKNSLVSTNIITSKNQCNSWGVSINNMCPIGWNKRKHILNIFLHGKPFYKNRFGYSTNWPEQIRLSFWDKLQPSENFQALFCHLVKYPQSVRSFIILQYSRVIKTSSCILKHFGFCFYFFLSGKNMTFCLALIFFWQVEEKLMKSRVCWHFVTL